MASIQNFLRSSNKNRNIPYTTVKTQIKALGHTTPYQGSAPPTLTYKPNNVYNASIPSLTESPCFRDFGKECTKNQSCRHICTEFAGGIWRIRTEVKSRASPVSSVTLPTAWMVMRSPRSLSRTAWSRNVLALPLFAVWWMGTSLLKASSLASPLWRRSYQAYIIFLAGECRDNMHSQGVAEKSGARLRTVCRKIFSTNCASFPELQKVPKNLWSKTQDTPPGFLA